MALEIKYEEGKDLTTMVSITCPCAECVHNGRAHKCTAKAINLKYRSMMTMHEGRMDMWICDKYKLSEKAKMINEILEFSDRWSKL